MDFSEVTQIPPKPQNETGFDFKESKEEMREFAESKLEEFKLDIKGWTFKFNSRIKKAVGKCRPRKRTIEVSSTWFLDFGPKKLAEEGARKDLFEDVVLHEIAHAVDFERRGTSDHSRFWKEVAREVGADPTRTCKIPKTLRALVAKWALECPECGKRTYYHRKPKPNKSCGRCSDSYDSRYHLELVELDN
jgi:predicted SprT family Zn-dependent metalloprotease